MANNGISELAKGISGTAESMRRQRGDTGKPIFLMVVQPDEDNVYDQNLLELELNSQGVRTVRRTFRQLHDELSTANNSYASQKSLR
ncbi:hypothetical protein ACH42_01935 [Endozoicomonas sp. (ex Bugula neritina AB1)]|nr:hypothetical protein ACH42_01935 [Endozoicomonas sp. (ex Bugula neritina AB1)]